MLALAEPTADEQFAAAFRRWGLDVDGTAAGEAAALLKARPAAVVAEVVAALDEWASERRRQGKPAAEWQRLAELAALLDDDPGWQRRELRAILARGRLPLERALDVLSAVLRPVPVPVEAPLGQDRARLRQLAEQADPEAEPALGLLTLARALGEAGEDARAERLLRAAVVARPREVVLHHALGQLLADQDPPRWAEAVEFYQAARVARPDLGVNLAEALRGSGRDGEGLALLARLVSERSDSPYLHHKLAYALRAKGRVDEAVGHYEEALRLDPKYSTAHDHLGAILCDVKGDPDGAIAHFQKAIDLDPKKASAHHNLGVALRKKGKLDEAVGHYEQALRIDPKLAWAHVSLGNVLYDKGKLDEAVGRYQQALRIDPKLAWAHCNLGRALRQQGRFEEALVALKRGHELASKQLGWPIPSGQWVRDAEPLAAMERRLQAILKGESRPAGTAEWLELVQFCRSTRRYAAAARLYADAFAADPKLADDLKSGHRYSAASCAALAAGGQGTDSPKPNDKERARLRRQALGWLRSELAARAKQSKSWWPGEAGQAKTALAPWQKDPDLAGVRDRKALAALPADERSEWDKLWDEVALCLDPMDAPAHYNLGNNLRDKGKLEEAISHYEQALRHDPKYAEAHCNLGHVLRGQGRFEEALACLKQGHDLGTKRPGWRYPSARWVRDAERLVALDQKLQAIRRGQARPADAAERLDLADHCTITKRYAAAARFYADAFAADPKLAAHRYKAARYAALAAAGKGTDAPKPDGPERARLRGLALGWLRAELALRAKQAESAKPQDRTAARMAAAWALEYWQQDADLAGVRGKEALAALPADERAQWEKFWAEVADLLRRLDAAKPAAPAGK
jgi:tetratricopeptide (TPR) repeat protein